jgi:hypothetical protein
MSFLAFEVNVLSRIDFDSVAMPFSDRPELGMALKRRGKRVMANSVLQSSWTKHLAAIQNNSERLTEPDVGVVLEDAYVPRHKVRNPALRNWFNETDTWWFDNVRQNLNKLESSHLFAIAASLAMGVGDYVLSFDEQTRELRQPLSVVYRRLWRNLPVPINNSQNNSCQNKVANEFLAESFADLLFLRIPPNHTVPDSREQWREEWLRESGDFWHEISASHRGQMGSVLQTKTQFLNSLERTLSIASNMGHWAIENSDGGLVTTDEIVDTVNKLRRVDRIYTKDFSELTGVKAAIITA